MCHPSATKGSGSDVRPLRSLFWDAERPKEVVLEMLRMRKMQTVFWGQVAFVTPLPGCPLMSTRTRGGFLVETEIKSASFWMSAHTSAPSTDAGL